MTGAHEHKPRHRIAVIVLDGLDWEWTNAHMDETAPLWRLAELGCHAPLLAPAPPLTPTSVAALLCGRHPEGFGWTRGSNTAMFATSQDLIRSRPWTKAAARNGIRTGLCNVPITWPGFSPGKWCWLVSGYPMSAWRRRDNRTRPWFSPPGLGPSLSSFGYPIGTIANDSGPGGTKDAIGLARAEARVATWAAEKAPPVDVLFLWLRATDNAGHHHWGTDRYAEVVKLACDTAERAASFAETAIVISDHGFDALDDPRCESYRASEHGPFAAAAKLPGGHAEEGVLFAAGQHIHARGLLPEQKLVEVAGGLFDLLQEAPPPGVVAAGPDWSAPVSNQEADVVRERLRALGYVK